MDALDADSFALDGRPACIAWPDAAEVAPRPDLEESPWVFVGAWTRVDEDTDADAVGRRCRQLAHRCLACLSMLSVKVSSKHQIVVPSQARRSLGIVAGDRLEVEVKDDSIVLRPRARRASERLRGLGSETWKGVDPVEYVRALRREWDERVPR